MMRRFSRLDVAVQSLEEAASIYETNFGFRVMGGRGADAATISVGGAEIRLISGGPAGAPEGAGQGICGLWLEADNVEEVAEALRQAGRPAGEIRREAGRRILAIEPAVANQVPLYIFDRRG